jgi:hypothetical protein
MAKVFLALLGVFSIMIAVNAQCQIDSPACNYTLTNQPSMTYAMNNRTAEFLPTLPGKYRFQFEATDLCTTKKITQDVTARCPTAPIVEATPSPLVVKQGGSATLSSVGSRAGFAGGSLSKIQWYVVSAPMNSGYTKDDVVSDSAAFTTMPLTIAGTYSFGLIVSDGCSERRNVTCFRVECNCGPTANAGATSTIWTNTPSCMNSNVVGNSAFTGAMDNRANLQSPEFYLDGSLSYDFDKSDVQDGVLTYDWDFIGWEPSYMDRTWTATTKVPATIQTFGYETKTVMEGQGGGLADYTKEFHFIQKPMLSQDKTTDSNPIPGNAVVTGPSAAVIPAGYPKMWPAFLAQEGFAAPTTTCHSDITKSQTTSTSVVPYSLERTSIKTPEGTDTVFCKIRIRQSAQAAVGNPGLFKSARNNPLAYLTVSNLNECKGLWTFQLTVTDGCGVATASKDSIRVNVRCNEPPVAIAACNNTQEWAGNSFDQVNLDGRSSMDADNSPSLTYTWSFVSSPALTAHCPEDGCLGSHNDEERSEVR